MIEFRAAMKSIASVFIFSTLLASGVVTLAQAQQQNYTVLAPDRSIAIYDTELFNLLLDRKNIIDNKNWFNREFSYRFDNILMESSAVKDKKSLIFLRKRLVSGPAPKPVYISILEKRYLYYEACQEHACDETYIELLFDVESKSMQGQLVVGGKEMLLGHPSPQEIALIKQLKSIE